MEKSYLHPTLFNHYMPKLRDLNNQNRIPSIYDEFYFNPETKFE